MYKIGSNAVIAMDIKKSVDTLVGIVDNTPSLCQYIYLLIIILILKHNFLTGNK
jgi:hypothetical protein